MTSCKNVQVRSTPSIKITQINSDSKQNVNKKNVLDKNTKSYIGFIIMVLERVDDVHSS